MTTIVIRPPYGHGTSDQAKQQGWLQRFPETARVRTATSALWAYIDVHGPGYRVPPWRWKRS